MAFKPGQPNAQPGMARPGYGGGHQTVVAHGGYWSTELCDCQPCGQCCLGWLYCSHACARSKHDGTNCCLNCMTGNPSLSQSHMRMNFGIGTYQECCSDIIDGTCCYPCANRRMLVESDRMTVFTTDTSTVGVPVLFKDGKFKGLTGLGQYSPGSNEQFMWKAGGLGDCWGGCCSHTFCYALCFPPCAAARARQYLDGSDCCFNVFFSNPFDLYHTTRHYYGIRGQCHEDFCVAFFCLPCSIDRVYREIFSNTYADVLATGSCNGCCGGAPVAKAPAAPGGPRQQQGMRRSARCCCC